MALNSKQLVFVREYLVDKNATRAAKAAGYSARTARSAGSELLTKPDIRSAIEEGIAQQVKVLEQRAAARGVTKERWLRELELIAFASMDDFAVVEEKEITTFEGEDNKK
jgi:phage terminase small subunit